MYVLHFKPEFEAVSLICTVNIVYRGLRSNVPKTDLQKLTRCVAVHLGVKMADTLSFTATVDMVDF